MCVKYDIVFLKMQMLLPIAALGGLQTIVTWER